MVQMLILFSPISFQAANIDLESDSGSAMNKGQYTNKDFFFFFFFLIKKDASFTNICNGREPLSVPVS